MEKELEAQLAEQRATLRSFRKLVASPEWGELVKIMENQQRVREFLLRQPLAGMDKVFEQEFQKGEASGIGLVLAMPQQVIDTAEAELQARGVDQNEIEE